MKYFEYQRKNYWKQSVYMPKKEFTFCTYIADVVKLHTGKIEIQYKKPGWTEGNGWKYPICTFCNEADLNIFVENMLLIKE